MNSLAENNERIEINAYFITLIVLACALPLSRFLMSASEFTLLALWLFDGTFDNNQSLPFLKRFANNISNKCRLVAHNKTLLIFVSIYLMHIVGVAYTSDFQYALKDLRIKLPILLVPIIMASMKPITTKQLHIILHFFIEAVIIGSLFTFGKYITHDFVDPRELSVFIYPIRFALNIVLAIFFSAYFLLYKHPKPWFSVSLVIVIVWLLFILSILESLSGIVCLCLTAAVLLIFFVIERRWRVVAMVACLLIVGAGVIFVYSTLSKMMTAEPVDFVQLDSQTIYGNPYVHDTTNFFVEDGRYTGLYVCKDELQKAWSNVVLCLTMV